MKIEELNLVNFRKFKNETVKFSENLNLIQGKNNAGKSSIFYAIYFALTGDAFNFRSPKEYINFDSNKMEVELHFTVQNKQYVIKSAYSQANGRTEYGIFTRKNGKPASVIESTEVGSRVGEVKDQIFATTGLDKKTIENVTYAAQQKFLQKIEGGSSQKQAMDYIFDVKTVDALSEQAEQIISEKQSSLDQMDDLRSRKKNLSEEADEMRSDIKTKKNQKISGIENQIEKSEKQLKSLKQDKKSLKKELEAKKDLLELKQKIQEKTKEKNRYQEQTDDLQSRFDTEISEAVEKIREKKEKTKADFDEADEKVEELEEAEERKSSIQNKINILETRLETKNSEKEKLAGKKQEHQNRFEKLKSSVRTRCSEKEIELSKTAVENQMEQTQEKLSSQRSRLGEEKARLEDLKHTHKEGKCEVCGREIQSEDSYEQRIESKKDAVKSLETKVEELEDRLEDLKKLQSDFATLHENKEQRKSLTTSIEELQEDIDGLQQKRDSKKSDLKQLREETPDKELNEVKDRRNKLREKHTELEQKLKEAEKAEEKLDKKNQKISELEEQINKMESRKSDLEPDHASEQEVEQLREKHSDKKSKINGVKEKIKQSRKRLNEQEEELNNKENKLEKKEDKLDKVKEELSELEELESKLGRVEEAFEAYSNAESEIRENKVKLLESKVFKWYQELAANHEFKSLSIDSDDYRLKGVPANADRQYSISDYQGGGQTTLTALAYQLALADMTGTNNFMMIDEPTDATDSQNRESLLEMIHKAVSQFSQILLITHHGVGKEKASSIIQVEKQSDGESTIEYPMSQ
jgi:DNA repair exonuclease SbcCD ATPase subunit